MIDLRRVRDAAIVGFALAFVFLIVEILIGNPFEVLNRPMQEAMERAALGPNEDIVLVDLDETSVGVLGDNTGLQGFWLPQVLEKLGSAKVVAVTLPYYQSNALLPDAEALIRSQKVDSVARWFRLGVPRTEELFDSIYSRLVWDDAVVNAISKNRNVYLGFNMLNESYSESVLPFSERVPNRSKDSLRTNTAILDKAGFLGPPMKWVLASNGIGFMDVTYDNDGLVRSVPLIALCKDNFYTSISFSLFQALDGRKDIDLPQSRVLKWGDKDIRLSEGYNYRVHFTSGLDDLTRIPVSAILAGKVPADTFKEKIVFVGSSFEPYAMSVPTPVDGHMPRMVLEANLLTGLMQGKQASPPNVVITFIVSFVLGVLGAFAVMMPWRKFALPGFAVLVVIFYIIVATSAANGIRIDFFTPLVVSGLALVTGAFIYHYTEGSRRTYLKQMVKQYFPAEQEKVYFERFLDLPYLKVNRYSVVMAVHLDFVKKERSLQEALKSFEEFRSRLLEIIRMHGGLRMSFTGNSSLFLFADKEGYTKACQASLEVRRFFNNFNAKYVTEGIGEFTLGIGLAAGETLVSTLGSIPLVDLVIFGTPVLLARELALLNFELKTKILIEGELIKHLPADSKVREMGELEIIGGKYVTYEYLR